MNSLQETVVAQVAEERQLQVNSSETHDFASLTERIPYQNCEDNNDSSLMMDTKHDVSDHEWRILQKIPPPVDLASRRRRTKNALSGNADLADKLIFESPQPTPIRTKFFDNDGEKECDINHPPSLTVGSFLSSVISPPSPISPPTPRKIETGLLQAADLCGTEPSFAESVNVWHFDVTDEDQHAQVKDDIIQRLDMPERLRLRASSRPVTYQFSHTTPSDFLDYYHREYNVVPGSYPDNDEAIDLQDEKSLEYRAEHSTLIKEEPLCVLTVEKGKSFMKDVPDSPASTIFEKVTAYVERDFHSEMNKKKEDISANNHGPSVKPDDDDGKSGLNCQGDGPNDVIRQILDPMRQDLVECIMDEFWIMFDQHWAAQFTQCPGGPSPSEQSNYQSAQANTLSSITPQQKRQRSEDEDSPDENGNKKPRKQGGGLQPCNKFDNLARFACPFRKYNPQKYGIHSHRVCALTGYGTIARVK